MVKYLNVKQKHIDEAERLRRDAHTQLIRYDPSQMCPIVLAVKEQIDTRWSGAWLFLRTRVTKQGAKVGSDFITCFDSHKEVKPARIRLRKD